MKDLITGTVRSKFIAGLLALVACLTSLDSCFAQQETSSRRQTEVGTELQFPSRAESKNSLLNRLTESVKPSGTQRNEKRVDAKSDVRAVRSMSKKNSKPEQIEVPVHDIPVQTPIDVPLEVATTECKPGGLEELERDVEDSIARVRRLIASARESSARSVLEYEEGGKTIVTPSEAPLQAHSIVDSKPPLENRQEQALNSKKTDAVVRNAVVAETPSTKQTTGVRILLTDLHDGETGSAKNEYTRVVENQDAAFRKPLIPYGAEQQLESVEFEDFVGNRVQQQETESPKKPSDYWLNQRSRYNWSKIKTSCNGFFFDQL